MLPIAEVDVEERSPTFAQLSQHTYPRRIRIGTHDHEEDIQCVIETPRIYTPETACVLIVAAPVLIHPGYLDVSVGRRGLGEENEGS